MYVKVYICHNQDLQKLKKNLTVVITQTDLS